MIDGIIKTGDFEWLDGNVLELRPENRFVKIRIPAGLSVDGERVMSIFIHNDNCKMVYQRERFGRIETFLEGNIKDEALFEYISSLRNQHSR